MFRGSNVLVAGGSGLIGHQLVDLLLEKGANVQVADLKNAKNPKVTHLSLDLTVYDNCLKATSGMDYVFNLLCVKGSPVSMKNNPASHFVPMVLFDTNLMKAAHKNKIKKYLYSSTLGVYSPAKVFYEDDVWKTFPSKNDRFAGWAKRMGELQTEAYQIQHGWNDICIVRPANTYGPYDDFHSEKSMVVPSLIKKVCETEDNKITVWGDGTCVRDFIHSKDVARGMLHIMKNCPGPNKPVNLGSGKGYSIKHLVETIIENSGKNISVFWDKTKPSGDKIRVLNTTRAEKLGFTPQIDLSTGITELINWYDQNESI